MRIILYIFVLGLFISCNSKAYKAIRSINNGYDIDSVAAEKRAKQISPCIVIKQDTTLVHDTIPKLVHDTTKTVKDSLITLPCPDGTTVSTTIKIVTYTIRTTVTKTNTYYITKTIEDKGKDIIIRDKVEQIEKKNKKIDFFMVWAIIATLLLLLSIIILLLKKSLK